MDNFNRVTLCLLVAAAVAIPGIAHAAYTANPRQPTTYWVGTDGAWRSSVTVEARSATLPTKYLKTTVPLSFGSLGRLAKAAMGGPVGLALTAAMVGYAVWDDSTQTFKESSPPNEVDTVSGWKWTWDFATFASQNEAGQFACSSLDNGSTRGPMTYTGGLSPPLCEGNWNGTFQTGISAGGSLEQTGENTCPAGYTDTGGTCTLTDPDAVVWEPATLTDEQIGTKAAESTTLTKQLADDSIDRGNWRGGNWPEMESSLTGIESALDRVADGTATQDDINLETGASAAPAPAPAQQQTSVEWPTFCSWAGVVCDFIDWYKAPGEPPPHPDLPIEEVTLSTWESGLGAGSCPAPYTTEFQGQTISYPFDDACWAAESVIRPLLLTLSLIGAGLIIVGRS